MSYIITIHNVILIFTHSSWLTTKIFLILHIQKINDESIREYHVANIMFIFCQEKDN